jgi:hypothetical protein
LLSPKPKVKWAGDHGREKKKKKKTYMLGVRLLS